MKKNRILDVNHSDICGSRVLANDFAIKEPSPDIQSLRSLRHGTTRTLFPPDLINSSLISISISSNVSNPSATNAGETITRFLIPLLANFSTVSVVDGLSHLAGPNRLW